MTLQYRQIFLQLQPDGIRTATFDNREHVVVPVIALVEGVIHAVNAPNPELVLAEEFSQAPQGWNGRPVVADHPVRNGEPVSANDPKVLEVEGFGHIFNTKADGKQLKMEAWLDPQKAERVGPKALDILERVKSGDKVEVSVGAFIGTDATSGSHGGKNYSGIWREITPDHLAMLKEGTIGACSVEMGCGAPRLARLYNEKFDLVGGESACEKSAKLTNALGKCKDHPNNLKTACECQNKEPKEMTPEELYAMYRGGLKTLHMKDQPVFRSSKEDDMSDMDLRDNLDTELRKSVPGFLGVEAVFMDSSKVVYATAPEDRLQFFRRSFKMSDTNVISLKDDEEEVTMVTRFEPLAQSPEQEPKQGESKMDEQLKARVQALIDSGKTSFVSADLEYLGSLDEERLSQLEASIVEPEPEPEPEPAPAPVVEPQTEEQKEAAFLEGAPKNIRDMVSKAKADEKAKRDGLIGALKTAQTAFSEADLAAMPTEQLQKLALVAPIKRPLTSASQAVDYSGNGVMRPAVDSDDIPDAPSITQRLAERNAS